MKNKTIQDDFFDETYSEKKIKTCDLCGSNRGKIIKVKHNGVKKFLCEYCFDEIREDE